MDAKKAKKLISDIPVEVFRNKFIGGFGKEQLFCDAATLGLCMLSESEVNRVKKWFVNLGIIEDIKPEDIQLLAKAAQSRAVGLNNF